MRVALFTDTYPDDINGVARTLGMLVGHAAARGHEVALVTPRVSAGGDMRAVVHRQLPGIPIPVYRQLQLARGIDRPGRAALTAFQPDVVHVATEATVGASGRRWARRHGIPLVTSFHTNFPEYAARYGVGWLRGAAWSYLRWFHGGARLTLCPSRATLHELRGAGMEGPIRIWSRGVDTRLFDPERRRASVRERLAPGAERILLYVGRIAPEKGIDALMDAFERIRATSASRVALVLVGDGPAIGRLRRCANADVHFPGFLVGEELAAAYASADVFAFPSETETFGNVVLEALASGVPAVCFARGGVTEMTVPGRTGVLVEPGDVRGFADACLALLQDDDERARLGSGARTEALSRRWDTVLDGVLEAWADASGRVGAVAPSPTSLSSLASEEARR